MGGDIPPRQDLRLQDSDEYSSREQHPQASIPNSTLPSEQPTNMEFEPYPRQQFAFDNYAPSGTLDMSAMAGALPEYHMRQLHQQPYQQHYQPPNASNTSMMYQYHQGTQFAGQTGANTGHSFVQQYPPQFVQGTPSRQQSAAYPHFTGNPGGPSTPQSFQNQTFMIQQSMMHGPAGPAHQPQAQQQQQPFYQHSHGSPAYPAPYGTRTVSGYSLPQLRVDNSMAQIQTPNVYPQFNPQAVRRSSSNSSLQTSALRGPPRKPKQSGHALWVGNLPPATHIIDLKDHFARDATEEIESVFLISKSNCAFVNYKTESSCAAAMTRFHDSRFQGVRLVCRLRRGNTSTAGSTQASVPPPNEAIEDGEEQEKSDQEASVTETAVAAAEPEPVEKVKEKFFVVKSLTVEDLERSVVSGIWATQAHNEAALNTAFQAAENVYLVFSANKSGEYFGYARMESSIDDDESTAHVELDPRPEVPEPGPTDLPLTIPTPATATAPKGRIIDDSARGTIFWEADLGSKEKEEQNPAEDSGNLSGEGYESASPGTPQAFGKPFKIKWMSTDRLPFYRTRGLRNPWNANREVKIARDGTEIEPSVGRRLVNMFHRPPVPSASPEAARQQQISQGPMGGSFMSPHGAAPGGMYGRSY